MLTIQRLKMMWIFTGILLFTTCFSLNGSKFEANQSRRKSTDSHGIDGVESDFFKDGGSGEASEEIAEIFPNINSQYSAGGGVEYPGSIFTTPQIEDSQEFTVTVGHVSVNNKSNELETQAEIVDNNQEQLQDSPQRMDTPLKNIEDFLKKRRNHPHGTMRPTKRPLKSQEKTSHLFFTKRKLWSASRGRLGSNKKQSETMDNEDGDTDASEDYDYDNGDDGDGDDDDDDLNSIYTLAHFQHELYTYVDEQVAAVNGSVVDILARLQLKIAQLEDQLTENMAYTSFLETEIRVSATPQSGDIRLLPSDNPGRVSRAGYLLFYTGSSWGFVCDDFFNAAAVKVACTQLGYPEPQSALEFAPRMFPRTSDTPMINRWQDTYQIVLDDVQCSGEESTIHSCSHSEIGRHDCAMNEIVYLSC